MPLVEALITHATAGAALDLRLARLIAWFKRQDLRPLGYASYLAFAPRVDWSDVWLRQLVRLVESPLEQVKAAVCNGEIPLRLAVLAPGQTTAEGQARWLAERPRPPRRAAPEPEVDVSGRVLVILDAARNLARVHKGAPIDNPTADRYILRHFRRRDPEATRRESMESPPAPGPLPPWCGVADPATALVGPWVEPSSLDDGLAKLDEVQAKRKRRLLDVGVLYRRVLAERAWAEEWASVGEMARACGLDLRTLQRAKRLVESLDALPDASAALACGEITMDEAKQIASVATEDTEEEWLRIVVWYTPPDFARLVELASRGVDVLPEAAQVVDTLIDALELPDRVTFSGVRRQMPSPRHQRIARDLPEAAAWFLQHARPPRPARLDERLRGGCENPECRRTTARLHMHHEVFRSQGGTDDEINLRGLCPACHLRGVHGGAISIRTVGSIRIWTYPGRRVLELLC